MRRHVAASSLWGFTEVGELVFDVHDGLVVDPTEERLRDEFGSTKVLHLPMQSIVRIEEVERKGQSVIRDAETGESVVTPFPVAGQAALGRALPPSGMPPRCRHGFAQGLFEAVSAARLGGAPATSSSVPPAPPSIGLSPSSTSPAL